MVQLYQSNLLQALGWALANSLWQMSLLWLVYQLLIALPLRQKPVIKHAAAFVMLLGGTGWFVASFVQRLLKPAEIAVTSPVNAGYNIPVSFSGLLQAALPYLSTAYLIVLVLLAIRFVYNLLNTRRLRLDVTPTPEWQHVVNKLNVLMGVSREVAVYVSEHILVPSTIGFLKPIILLPVATVNQLSVEQVESVIMHEMAHIRRNDFLVNLIVSFVEVILFFNPFAHLLARTIRRECELCCDDVVLKQRDAETYAHALLLLEKAKQRPVLAMAATGRQGMLLGRIKRILNMPDQDVKYRHKIMALVVVAGLVMITGLLTPKELSRQDTESVTRAKQQTAPLNELNAPLPFIMKITPGKSPAPAKKKDALVKGRTAPAKAKQPEKELHVFHHLTPDVPGHPVLPPNPPVPPAPLAPEDIEAQVLAELSHILPEAYREGAGQAPLPKAMRAPDPRDRKGHAIMLRGNALNNTEPMIRVLEERDARAQDLIRMNKNKVVIGRSIELERVMKEKERAEREFFQFYSKAQAREMEKAVEEHVRVISTKKNQVKPALKAMSANEEEMTIIMVQDGEEIRITVKDSR